MVLHFVDQGEGSPVVLLHGLFGAASNLGGLARHLQSEYRVISLDMRNHGRSPHHATMSYTEMAQDVVDTLDSLGIANAVVIGHSMGGKVAMQLAMRWPERVSRLVVVDIAPVAYEGTHQKILEGFGVLLRTHVTSRQQADSLMAEFEPELGVRSFLLKNLSRNADGSYGLKVNVEAIRESYHANIVAGLEGNPYLGSALFIYGGASGYVRPEHHGVIRALFPVVQFEEIAGAGHWLHAERPAEFNAAVATFLS